MKKVKALEEGLEKFNKELEAIEEALTDSDLYQEQSKSILKELLAKQAKIKGQRDEAEEAWFMVSEELHEAEQSIDL